MVNFGKILMAKVLQNKMLQYVRWGILNIVEIICYIYVLKLKVEDFAFLLTQRCSTEVCEPHEMMYVYFVCQFWKVNKIKPFRLAQIHILNHLKVTYIISTSICVKS